MKKTIIKAVCIVLAVLLIALLVVSAAFRRITVTSGSQFVDKCPRLARPGQEVTVTTAVVSDGEIYVNGVEDSEASRRVEFKFVLKDAEMIAEMNRILSGEDEESN